MLKYRNKKRGFKLSEMSYFSVSYDLITKNEKISYNLYVNASSIDKAQKFIKVFSKNNFLSIEDLVEFKRKYLQLYVSEDERKLYMSSLVKSSDFSDLQTVDFIKDSAVEYLHRIFDDTKEFNTEILSQTIGECRFAVESMIDVLDDYTIDSLKGLIGNLSSHDFYTFDHSINVSMYCISILRAIKPEASRDELVHVGLGGLLHDLGKIKVPTHILNSPGGLNDDQYAEIKKHPGYGIDLLKSGEIDVSEDLDLNIIARVVHEHHENWDGTGYPSKKAGKEIHLYARICTIADFFDAVTTKRSYNDVLPITQAMGVMERFKGIKLDPNLFKAFSAHIEHGNIKSGRQLKMANEFDPTIPYAKLPIEEIKSLFENEDFGKIKIKEN
jgi:HD-GYP domain-containing protein (c-di-GMP phosphodiesterase class II)